MTSFFDLLYLRNSKSYVETVGILPKALSKRNPMKKSHPNQMKNKKSLHPIKCTVFGPFYPFYSKMAANSWNPLTYYFCTHQNKYIKKRFVKIGLKIKKLLFLALALYNPLYLRNGKSYPETIDTILKGIFIRNPKKKNGIKI